MTKKKNNLIRFSGVGVQMGAIIGVFTWLGLFLDKKYETETPWWTLGLLLFGVISAMYLVIKEISKLNK